ncbi:excinuclease ABC subunit UvrC [Mogibacterium kristiansenii]|uniref:UvrABC system protein C n=1 Tax=Mogibacterium kristiansenii TaxID=2606708 RepID=A0A6N7X814_9FIRM|nr:excinuclease ABC subunit UvrC [Mogibacterium kristiansenii]MST70733.1 excinuclease ABC subunit UvrC [Mogibacterium kristiansenii]
MFDINEELKKLPTCPGVYMHKDRLGTVIYVGKAVNLRNRVRQYFRNSSQHSPKVRSMVSNIAEFDYITCGTEMEALILECNLIKKYMPKYNILLKDDKTYPYIEVTMSEEFPRVIRTREVKRDENRYFGPYSDSTAVWRILKMIDEMYPLKKCSTLHFPENTRPCLNYFIGKCKGICVGKADREEYLEMIRDILGILGGRDAGVIRKLERKMMEASDALKYEEAAKYRDYIRALRSLSEKQRATMVREHDIDILIPIRTHRNQIVAQYRVREGKMIGREIIYMNDETESTREELLSAFLKQYYLSTSRIPKEVIVPVHPEEEDLISELLNHIDEMNAKAGTDVPHKTRLYIPERGEKKAILDMTLADSVELARSLDERANRDEERKKNLRQKISELIRRAAEIDGTIPRLLEEDDEEEYRVEAYDISNMNGLDTVGAMVVYEGSRPVRNDYRKFRIRTAEGDDYGSLQEVMYRRLKRAREGDPGFSRYPDIMFIDGGLGQVHAVKAVMDAFRLTIPVVGLAKDDAHRTRAVVFTDGSEIDLKSEPLLFSYAGNIQEEVHRFAITFHRGTRGKKMTHSVLEEIPKIGPKRRKALMEKFRSIDAIRKASYEELMETEGMNSQAAESVLEFFQQ